MRGLFIAGDYKDGVRCRMFGELNAFNPGGKTVHTVIVLWLFQVRGSHQNSQKCASTRAALSRVGITEKTSSHFYSAILREKMIPHVHLRNMTIRATQYKKWYIYMYIYIHTDKKISLSPPPTPNLYCQIIFQTENGSAMQEVSG